MKTLKTLKTLTQIGRKVKKSFFHKFYKAAEQSSFASKSSETEQEDFGARLLLTHEDQLWKKHHDFHHPDCKPVCLSEPRASSEPDTPSDLETPMHELRSATLTRIESFPKRKRVEAIVGSAIAAKQMLRRLGPDETGEVLLKLRRHDALVLRELLFEITISDLAGCFPSCRIRELSDARGVQYILGVVTLAISDHDESIGDGVQPS